MENIWSAGQPFYASTYDRYRLIELLFERERKAAGLTHDQLAQRCNTPYVKPYHLTTIQNITRTINDPRHQMDRGRILMALTWGLQLPRWKIDLLLTLFDGRPLTEEEWRRFISPYAPESNDDVISDGDALRESVRRSSLRAIGALLGDLWPDGGPTPSNVTISDTRFDSLVARKRAVLVLESQPGMRLAVRSEPGSIADPPPQTFDDWMRWNGDRAGAKQSPQSSSPLSIQDLRTVHQLDLERQRVCLEHVEKYGEAAIHSRPLLSRLLRQPGAGERLRARLRRLTALLWEYDSFHVALAETTPALELKIIGFDRALMIGAGGSVFDGESWPLAVFWNDPKSVLVFVSDFWENYYAIDRARRDKASVIRELCEMAQLAHPRDRRSPAAVPGG